MARAPADVTRLLGAVSLALVVAAASAACSKKRSAPPAAPGTFGATCSLDGDCTSGACFPDQQGPYCSTRCKGDDECAAPSSGKCNRKGFCKR